MSISPKWDHPDRSHVKSADLKAIKDDMWATLFFASASLCSFQLGWNLTSSTKTPEGLPIQRIWENAQTGRLASIVWEYNGDLVSEVEFYWNDGIGWGLTVPGRCTPTYDSNGLLESYTWS